MVQVQLLVNGAVIRTLEAKGMDTVTLSGSANVLLPPNAEVRVRVISDEGEYTTPANKSFLTITRERLH
jgi:hypothetical protein